MYDIVRFVFANQIKVFKVSSFQSFILITAILVETFEWVRLRWNKNPKTAELKESLTKTFGHNHNNSVLKSFSWKVLCVHLLGLLTKLFLFFYT